MIEKILVPTDGSEHARKAVEFACDLAVKYGATVYILHVIPALRGRMYDQAALDAVEASFQRDGSEIIKEAESEARNRGVGKVESAAVRGDPASEIREFAKEKGVDMIVMGSRGAGSVETLLLGSVSHKVCHLADCTCITVK
jgi:nucleotide-binding universal stress UspA family protein